MPHLYPRGMDTGKSFINKHKEHAVRDMTLWFNRQSRYASDNGMSLLIGEWGVTHSQLEKGHWDEYLKMVTQITDKYNIGWLYWTGGPGAWGPRNADRTTYKPVADIISKAQHTPW